MFFFLHNLHDDCGLASAKKSNADSKKMVFNMFLAQALLLNWFEIQPPLALQSKKTRLIKKPVFDRDRSFAIAVLQVTILRSRFSNSYCFAH